MRKKRTRKWEIRVSGEISLGPVDLLRAKEIPKFRDVFPSKGNHGLGPDFKAVLLEVRKRDNRKDSARFAFLGAGVGVGLGVASADYPGQWTAFDTLLPYQLDDFEQLIALGSAGAGFGIVSMGGSGILFGSTATGASPVPWDNMVYAGGLNVGSGLGASMVFGPLLMLGVTEQSDGDDVGPQGDVDTANAIDETEDTAVVDGTNATLNGDGASGTSGDNSGTIPGDAADVGPQGETDFANYIDDSGSNAFIDVAGTALDSDSGDVMFFDESGTLQGDTMADGSPPTDTDFANYIDEAGNIAFADTTGAALDASANVFFFDETGQMQGNDVDNPQSGANSSAAIDEGGNNALVDGGFSGGDVDVSDAGPAL